MLESSSGHEPSELQNSRVVRHSTSVDIQGQKNGSGGVHTMVKPAGVEQLL